MGRDPRWAAHTLDEHLGSRPSRQERERREDEEREAKAREEASE
jgi:hypothetical protein